MYESIIIMVAKINRETNLLDIALIDGSMAIGDSIFLEILQGFEQYKKTLSTLDQYELFGDSMVSKNANNYRILRKKGFTFRKISDVIIATFGIENNFPLLFCDRDFLPFVKYLHLHSV